MNTVTPRPPSRLVVSEPYDSIEAEARDAYMRMLRRTAYDLPHPGLAERLTSRIRRTFGR